MEQQLTQEQALGVLVQAAKVGQSKGAYTLEDAEIIARAIRVFTPKQEETPQLPAVEKDTEMPAGEKVDSEKPEKK